MSSHRNAASYYYKLFRVKRNDGRITTVSIDPVLVTEACQVMGGLNSVGKVVRQAALCHNEGMHKNCSSFVSQRLREATAEMTVHCDVAADGSTSCNK